MRKATGTPKYAKDDLQIKTPDPTEVVVPGVSADLLVNQAVDGKNNVATTLN